MQPVENSVPQAGCIQPAFVRYQPWPPLTRWSRGNRLLDRSGGGDSRGAGAWRGRFIGMQLEEHHLPVAVAVFKQLLVRALIDNPSVCKQHDSISMGDRRETMGDDERCSAGH